MPTIFSGLAASSSVSLSESYNRGFHHQTIDPIACQQYSGGSVGLVNTVLEPRWPQRSGCHLLELELQTRRASEQVHENVVHDIVHRHIVAGLSIFSLRHQRQSLRLQITAGRLAYHVGIWLHAAGILSAHGLGLAGFAALSALKRHRGTLRKIRYVVQ